MLGRTLRHERAVTWLPVLAVAPTLILLAALDDHGPPVTLPRALVSVLGCLPLALRGRLSFAPLALLLTLGTLVVNSAVEPGDAVVLIPIVALAELAARGDRRRSLGIGLAIVPCVVISIVPFADNGAELIQLVVRDLALCLLALAGGDIVRSRRVAAEGQQTARDKETQRRLGEERLRIARDVHDVVAHAMVAINVQAGVAAHLLDRDPDQARSALRAIKTASGDALSDLRSTLGVLREREDAAPVAPAAGLHDLEELTGTLRAAGVRVGLDVELDRAPAAVHAAGYRIVQEALTNALRHAGASRVDVRVRRAQESVRVEVVDDGIGEAASCEGTGNGLRGMRERAVALGGELACEPVAGGGWRVLARLPATTTEAVVER